MKIGILLWSHANPYIKFLILKKDDHHFKWPCHCAFDMVTVFDSTASATFSHCCTLPTWHKSLKTICLFSHTSTYLTDGLDPTMTGKWAEGIKLSDLTMLNNEGKHQIIAIFKNNDTCQNIFSFGHFAIRPLACSGFYKLHSLKECQSAPHSSIVKYKICQIV